MPHHPPHLRLIPKCISFLSSAALGPRLSQKYVHSQESNQRKDTHNHQTRQKRQKGRGERAMSPCSCLSASNLLFFLEMGERVEGAVFLLL